MNQPSNIFCPGRYCGRVLVNDTLGECGGCIRGYKPNEWHICTQCSEPLQLYDWIYLAFMIIIFIIIQCYFIDRSIKRNQFNFLTFCLYCTVGWECIVASVLSILLFNPNWDLNLKTCGVKSFFDWYTLFVNPSPDEKFYCTHEAVYPLYSIVFVFYIISLCFILSRHVYVRFICFILYLLARPNHSKKLYPKDHIIQNTYLILYSIPALLFIHAIFAGVIYYIYPHLILIGSVISIAVHFSYYIDQRPKSLVKSLFQFRNFLVVFFHWFLHVFGIISLTELKHYYYYFLFLVPCPTLFYIYTAKFTDPALL